MSTNEGVIPDSPPVADPIAVVAAAPSYMDRVQALNPDARAKWDADGDLTAAEALTKPADPSPAIDPALVDDADSTPAAETQTTQPSAPETEGQRRSRLKRERDATHWDELLEDRTRLKIENEALRKLKTAAPPATPTAPVEAPIDPNDPKPIQANYTDFDEFVIELGAWASRGEHRKIRAAEASERKLAQEAIEREEYSKRIEPFKRSHSDFNEIFDKVAAALEPHKELSIAVANSPVTDQMVYFLGKNPAELQRLAKSGPRSLVELGKLEARFETAANPTKKPALPTAGLPAPSATVSLPGSGTVADDPLKRAYAEKDYRTIAAILDARDRDRARAAG